jgi:HD-like signal output (HDOD) protein
VPLQVPAKWDESSRHARAEADMFAAALTADVASGSVDVPSFPDVAVRVRRVLADDDVGAEKVVRVVGSEPALAARVLQLANSAALNAGRKRISDLRTAITRMGFIMVRSAAIAFAVVQLRKAATMKGLEKHLDQLWRRSTLVAALAYAVARRFTKVNADMAMFAGLMHGIGKLYILTRVSRFPGVFADREAYEGIVRGWHAKLARALLEGWETPPEIVYAVTHYEEADRTGPVDPDLTDVLTVADLLASHRDSLGLLELELPNVEACRRMNLDLALCHALLNESEADVADLTQALGP